MNSLNDIVFVTRNYQGLCEENFLSTIDEFVEEYGVETPAFKGAVIGAEPYRWAVTHYVWADESFDVRTCQGPDDLISFLYGDYNSNREDLENSNPGSSYDDWYWENRSEFFSEAAVEKVMEYAKRNGREFINRLLDVMPDFPMTDSMVEDIKPALSSVIKNAAAEMLSINRETSKLNETAVWR